MLAPYTNNDDDHEIVNLELSKLQLFWWRTNPRNVSSLNSLGLWSLNLNLKLSKFYSCSDKELTLKSSAPYTTYGDDHKMFNLELSKLQLLLWRANSQNVSFLH